MDEKHLEMLDGTDYKVDVFRDDDGDDIIEVSKLEETESNILSYVLLASEIFYDGVTEDSIKNKVAGVIQKDKKSMSLYGTYTGKKRAE